MLTAVSDHYEARRSRTGRAVLAARQEWRRRGDDLDGSWSRIAPRLVAIVTAAQYGAAQDGAAYVPQALQEQDAPSQALAEVNPAAMAGFATSVDGDLYGSLSAVLYGAVVRARVTPASSLTERLEVGGRQLSMLVQTQVADAGRMSAATAIAVRPGTGWVRQINPPCCQRCAVLAGKWFRHNQGFDRHPGCDCTHIPQAEDTPDNPGTFIGPDDVKDLTIAQRKAIDLGADMNQVINATRQGAVSTDRMWTSEGTTKRGHYAEVRRAIDRSLGEATQFQTTAVGRRGAVANYPTRRTRKLRMTPQAIVRYAEDDADMYRMLAQNGYLAGRDYADIARAAS